MSRFLRTFGFTKVELLIVVAVIVLFVLVFLPSRSRDKERKRRIECVGNLKNIGLAFRIFATDNGDRFPWMVFATNGLDPASIPIQNMYMALSNEFPSPRRLHCPADAERNPAKSFEALTVNNISYFIGLSADESRPQSLLGGDRDLQTNGVPVSPGVLTITTNMVVSPGQKIHRWSGDLLLGDGSVQQFTTNRARGYSFVGQRLLIP